MVAVDGDLSEEKLRLLLDEGHESDLLDYKSTLATNAGRDALDRQAQVELAKDIAAMQANGGYIVIGADDGGRPSPLFELTEAQAQQCFDEAKLRTQLRRWIEEPFGIRTAIRSVNERVFAAIFVAPRVDGICVIKADGIVGERTVFRHGDVFVRHGTASERWQQHDVNTLVERIVEARKETWRAELAPVFEKLQSSRQAGAMADDVLESLSWRIDARSYALVVVELLRRNDAVALRYSLNTALEDGMDILAKSGIDDEFLTLIDRISSAAALARCYGAESIEVDALGLLKRFYEFGFVDQRQNRILENGTVEQLWKEIIVRVCALGALCVRRGDWRGVVNLVIRVGPQDIAKYWPSWIRHAYTMAARAGMLEGVRDGRKVEVSFLQFVRQYALEMPFIACGDLRDEDELLNSICQFDLLAGLIATERAKDVGPRTITVAYARYNSYRTEPIIEMLIDDAASRAQLTQLGDDDLALFLAESDRIARGVPASFLHWDGFQSPKITEFIRKHLAEPGGAVPA